MKKLILTLGIAIASLSFGYSQDKAVAVKGGSADKMIANMTKTCSLTPDQVAKIKPLAEAFMKSKGENKAKYASDPEGMKTANKASRDSFIGQIKTILTPDQMEKFKAQQKANKEAKDKDKD